MAIRVSDIFSLVKNHALPSIFLLLLFTPPLFPVVVFFSPLIISTALCVLALVSIRVHFGSSAGELDNNAKGGKIDGLESSVTEEKVGRVVRMSREEVTWLEWMKGYDGSMRDVLEKRPTEEYYEQSKLQLVEKQPLSFLWETINGNDNETAWPTLQEEHIRPTLHDNSIFNSSLGEDLSEVDQKEAKEDVGEADTVKEEGSSLRFSFFQKDNNVVALSRARANSGVGWDSIVKPDENKVDMNQVLTEKPVEPNRLKVEQLKVGAGPNLTSTEDEQLRRARHKRLESVQE